NHFTLLDGRRWPEVDLSCLPIDVPFAWLVKLLQNIEEVEAPAREWRIGEVRTEKVQSSIWGVEKADAFVRFGPIELPVTERPDLIARNPPAGFVSCVGNRVLGRSSCDAKPAAVRCACVRVPGQLHRFAVEEEFQPGINGWARKPSL